MTRRQQAHELLDKLPRDRIAALIQEMKEMITADNQSDNAPLQPINKDNTSKMEAHLRMQELRRETAKYDISTDRHDDNSDWNVEEYIQHCDQNKIDIFRFENDEELSRDISNA